MRKWTVAARLDSRYAGAKNSRDRRVAAASPAGRLVRRALPVHVDLAQGVPSGLPGEEYSRRHVLSEGRQGFVHGLVFDDHPDGGVGLGPDQNRALETLPWAPEGA